VCRATLYGSPVSAMRWRMAVFWALFRVMIHRFPAGLPASARQGEWHDWRSAHESWTLVLVAASARAGR
jgi:hypothetical protein